MLILIAGKYAHRLLEDGVMESLPLDGKKVMPLDPEAPGWKDLPGETMGMTGGDKEFIRNNVLMNAKFTLPDVEYVLPFSSPGEQKPQDASTVV
jgi:hypothetical protein